MTKRRHTAIDLERIQRIFLGLDDEEMEFSEKTIAAILADIAARWKEADHGGAMFVGAVAHALADEDEDWKLILKSRKPGRYVSPHKEAQRHNRDMDILRFLALLEKHNIKTEAAVSHICEHFAMSRASVFNAIKRAENYLETGRKISHDSAVFANPRSNKSD